MKDPVFTPKKVSEILGIKESGVKKLLREGKLKGFKMGKYWRVLASDLNEYIDKLRRRRREARNKMPLQARRKIKYRQSLTRKEKMPNSIEYLYDKIEELKVEFTKSEGDKKIVIAETLRKTVLERKQLMASLDEIGKNLKPLAKKAYPEVHLLLDMSADEFVEQCETEGTVPLFRQSTEQELGQNQNEIQGGEEKLGDNQESEGLKMMEMVSSFFNKSDKQSHKILSKNRREAQEEDENGSENNQKFAVGFKGGTNDN